MTNEEHIKKLEALIKRMKNCWNCKYSYLEFGDINCRNTPCRRMDLSKDEDHWSIKDET